VTTAQNAAPEPRRLEPDSRAPSGRPVLADNCHGQRITTDQALCERLSFVAAGEQIPDIVKTVLNC
jgi:hypothetical protein